VSSPGGRIEGAFGGLDEDGALLLDTPDGRRRIVAGDVGPRGAGDGGAAGQSSSGTSA
jgi:hypothetical protein